MFLSQPTTWTPWLQKGTKGDLRGPGCRPMGRGVPCPSLVGQHSVHDLAVASAGGTQSEETLGEKARVLLGELHTWEPALMTPTIY